ncbi:hypothetical protein JOS77_08015 [Chromobacterium haemolyticum]|nr:hypothetical protein JOS77_08015 [Chromobacterium haemolyticum]
MRRALALEASHAGALTNLGLLLQAQRRWAEAEACLSAAAERTPEQAQVLGNGQSGLMLVAPRAQR